MKTILSMIVIVTGMLSAGQIYCQEHVPARLEITVVDEEDQPVPDAEVTLYEELDAYFQSDSPVRVHRTDSTGMILLTDLEPNPYFIEVRKGLKSNDRLGVKTAPLEAGRINFAIIRIER